MIQENQREFLVNHIVDKLTDFLVKDYSMDLPSALKKIYESKIYSKLQDKELALYEQSPSYIYVLLVESPLTSPQGM